MVQRIQLAVQAVRVAGVCRMVQLLIERVVELVLIQLVVVELGVRVVVGVCRMTAAGVRHL